MSEETKEVFQAMKRDKVKRRADNTYNSTNILNRNGFTFISKNNGAHLIVGEYNFWPSTGLFTHRKTGKSGRGVFKLIAKIKETP